MPYYHTLADVFFVFSLARTKGIALLFSQKHHKKNIVYQRLVMPFIHFQPITNLIVGLTDSMVNLLYISGSVVLYR